MSKIVVISFCIQTSYVEAGMLLNRIVPHNPGYRLCEGKIFQSFKDLRYAT